MEWVIPLRLLRLLEHLAVLKRKTLIFAVFNIQTWLPVQHFTNKNCIVLYSISWSWFWKRVLHQEKKIIFFTKKKFFFDLMTRGLETYLYLFYACLHSISCWARLAAAVSMIVLVEIFLFHHFPFLGLGTLAVKMRAISCGWSIVFFFRNITKARFIEWLKPINKLHNGYVWQRARNS